MEILSLIKKEYIVMLLAATPISELRGAIPFGISLGLSPLNSTIISIIGNIVPVPFLLILLEPIFKYFENVIGIGRILTWAKNKGMKHKEKIKKYSVFGLFILVAVPLPSTGAWTGCVVATLFKIKFRDAMIAIISGIVASGIVVFLLSYKVVSLL
ncbi:putative membrane protein [Gottschalkia purinilytica]|uniref:Putative membrane protein n=1 Tax=Gottschalkia purinilytica TaxID=1503 RepID=A0A0L0WDX6_GOTPU|nr:small multi-drug export protein [Gottschalkia purinilytica]KNF09682.1 putative membrane protein [Gottschalkia purinilytica]